MTKTISWTVSLAAYLLLCLPVSATEPDELQVMLQGSSVPELTGLVEGAGGSITHDLHIINAVGAKLTADQLEEVLSSPLVTRHIDDLSNTKRPEKDTEKEEEGCKVRGHIELDFTAQGIEWPLYNKRPDPAALERLELSWPAELGELEALTIGELTVSPALYRFSKTGALEVDFPSDQRPVIAKRASLKARFNALATKGLNRAVSQKDFHIKADFAGGCSTDLVPGYENNDKDFYYNSVAGIDALHLQGVTGKGITVAVVDSGLWEHPALTRDTSGVPRVVARYDALTDRAGEEVVDESGHGTHMSSILVNSDSTIRGGQPTGTYKGVAPDAQLVAVKVLDREGLAHVLEIVRAIQWVVDHREKYSIRVLNLSFAQAPRWSYWEDPVNQAVMRAWADGIAVVAAAGNEGPEAGTVGSPGNLPYVITVGAVTDSWTPDTRDDDYIPDFSSQGPTPEGHVKPDLVALGGHMTGLINLDSAIALDQPEDMLRTGEFVSTGSSQAAALVSGVLALLLQLEPELTPNDLKCKLTSSAEPAINRDGTLAYSPFQQGYGYVTATRAVTLGETGCGNPGLDIAADMAGIEHFYGPAEVNEEGGPSLPGFDEVVSSKPSELGLSTNRVWGVKDHMERKDLEPTGRVGSDNTPYDWLELYLLEKAAIEKLSRDTAAESSRDRDD